jgi:tetratricopeptide (TPR) repeat protein
MVLKHCRLATLLTLCLLQACSRYSLKPEPVIVPVNVPSPPSLIEKNSPTSLVHLPRTQATQINEEQTPTQASTSDKPEKKQVIIESTILETLLSKATKAIKAQQWLRAQRVLEQALRVKPYHAKTYQLYGEVSASMGLKEKAKSMYLRALNLEKNRQAQDHIRHKLIELEKE